MGLGLGLERLEPQVVRKCCVHILEELHVKLL